jgi:hypothetical protein
MIGKGNPPCKFINANYEGIAQNSKKIIILEKSFKVIQAYEFTVR